MFRGNEQKQNEKVKFVPLTFKNAPNNKNNKSTYSLNTQSEV